MLSRRSWLRWRMRASSTRSYTPSGACSHHLCKLSMAKRFSKSCLRPTLKSSISLVITVTWTPCLKAAASPTKAPSLSKATPSLLNCQLETDTSTPSNKLQLTLSPSNIAVVTHQVNHIKYQITTKLSSICKKTTSWPRLETCLLLLTASCPTGTTKTNFLGITNTPAITFNDNFVK